jgi:hypothetical protein
LLEAATKEACVGCVLMGRVIRLALDTVAKLFWYIDGARLIHARDPTRNCNSPELPI